MSYQIFCLKRIFGNEIKLKELTYKGKIFYIFNEVYFPADDTYLLLDNLKLNYGDFVLELGTGCGILGIFAAEKASKVIMTDISPIALKCAKKNAKLNNLADKIEIRQGDLFDPIKIDEKFDIIIFNPPYLPIPKEEKKGDWLEKAWNGGENGRDIIDRFLSQFENFLKEDGRVQMIETSLSNYKKTYDCLIKYGFITEIEAEKKFAFEKIVLFLIKK